MDTVYKKISHLIEYHIFSNILLNHSGLFISIIVIYPFSKHYQIDKLKNLLTISKEILTLS